MLALSSTLSPKLRSLILTLITFAPALCIAQDWYEIEIIIFEHKTVAQSDSEDLERWPRDLDLTWPENILELEPAVERSELPEIMPPFEELVFDQRRMNNDSYALRVREPYDLLWHKAWRAPLLPEDKAPWILVQAGGELGSHYRLEGAIRLHLSRYLHLNTNLWLTEVSGEAIIEDVGIETPSEDNGQTEDTNSPTLSDTAVNDVTNSSLSSVIKEVEAKSEFDWSQLPEPNPVRWGCNYIRELWPEDDRLLPADYYEDPAPADWYFPFGCRTPSELIERYLPYFVNLPTTDRYAEEELKLYYPELFQEQGAFVTPSPATDIDSNSEYEGLTQPPSGANGFENSKSVEEPINQNLQINTQALLDNIEVLILDGEGLYEEAPEIIAPAPKVHYPISEIIHIQGKRRMRSGEFHYIDHPKIGVLALVHPVEKPELILEEVDPDEIEKAP